MSKSQKTSSNIGRKFLIFVKPIDEKGLVDERNCGWLGKDLKPTFRAKDALQFTEKEHGHGSFEDWIELIGEDHPDWEFSPNPTYVDTIKSLNP